VPVDPGNLLLIGTAKGHPVIAAPGCARSPKENGLNTHTEALEPMAGALWTSYDTSFPAMWVEAMKRRSRAGGEPTV
jgi:molybdopterin biosynthesis enzyme